MAEITRLLLPCPRCKVDLDFSVKATNRPVASRRDPTKAELSLAVALTDDALTHLRSCPTH